MLRAKNLLWALFLTMPFLCLDVSANITDDYTPEVTARVARISFIRGDVQIRRADQQDWERVTRDLPLVEGDEIATDRNALVEIQFDRDSYLRLAEYSYLKIINLKDEGIALSLPQGTLSLSVLNFDKDRGYFEIDAPSTTIAVQRSGMYRIDAGDERSQDIRVTVTENGEARVYSTNSGFTLRNGRSARIYIAGSYAGEWEMADASRYGDEFDKWVSDRETIIAKRLKNAYYDKYYDRDFYGAEELGEHGEWIYSRDYGYVWRPYQNSLRSYANWSPYRYGHWRWVPPYGWTWVNDEPWGWATYHHGRWIWTGGYWAWTPYGYYRPHRSWWRPALVVVATWGNNVCWYPLPYNAGYYNYNQYYHNTTIVKNTTIIKNTTVVVNPTPTPTGTTQANTIPSQMPTRWTSNIPPTGVVWTPVSSFGTNTKNFQTPSLAVAQEIITKTPETVKTAPILPTIKDLKGNISQEIVAEAPPKAVKVQQNVKIGATERTTDAPLDPKLQETKIFGNREPVKPGTRNEGIGTGVNGGSGTRKLGAVNRPVVQEESENNSDTKDAPVRPVRPSDNPTVRQTGGGTRSDDRDDAPVRTPRNDRKTEPPPVYNPPTRRDDSTPPVRPPAPKRDDAPPVRVTPKQDSPPSYTPPPPRRSDPQPPPQPPKRNDPPPSKSEPNQDDKPPAPVRSKDDSKDG